MLSTLQIILNLIIGPDLQINRESHSCSGIRSSKESHQFTAIVVGGHNNDGRVKSVEILDLSQGNIFDR